METSVIADSAYPFPATSQRSREEMASSSEAEGVAGAVEVPTVMPEFHGIGSILEVHRTPPPWDVGIFLLTCLSAFIAFLVLGYFVGWKQQSLLHPKHVLLSFGVAFIAIATIYAFLRDFFLPLTVLVFRDGLVKIRGRRVDVFAWTDVAAYYEGFTDSDQVVPGRVQRHDGRVLAFKELDPGSQRKLDERAWREVWLRLFPNALSRYEAGEAVKYGKLGVSKTGILKGGKLFEWNRIGAIQVQLPDTLFVRGAGVFYWSFTMRIRKIPNFFILRHFIERNRSIEMKR